MWVYIGHVCRRVVSHRCLAVRVGQDTMDSDLALVQVVEICPQVLSLSLCRTETLPSVVLPLGVLLREGGHSSEKFIIDLEEASGTDN